MKVFACIGALAAVQLLAGVEGHGRVTHPPARVVHCHTGKNKGCWNNYPDSLQNFGRFPNISPLGDFDGVIASGMLAAFRELDEQGEDRWYKNRIRPGGYTFKWHLPANHVTKDFRYWITKTNWDPNGPLRVASFENKPFCTKVVNGGVPHRVSHWCNVPWRKGYHVVLAEWKIGDNKRTFYNVIDLDFSGNGGGGNGPAVFGLQPLTRYRNIDGLQGKKVSKWAGKGLLCFGPNARGRWPKGCKRNIHLNKLRWNPPKGGNPAPGPAPKPAGGNKPAPKPAQNAGQCTRRWGNCWKTKCCKGGFRCVWQSKWYSQCRPNNGPKPKQKPAPKPAQNAGRCTGRWGNCRKTKCCKGGFRCVWQSKWYSQCKPQ